jgi:hypothetical protein
MSTHHGKRGSGPAKSFRRLVLLSEDVYKSAMKCMEKDAINRAADHTLWYSKDVDDGTVHRAEKVQIQDRTAGTTSTAPAAPTESRVPAVARIAKTTDTRDVSILQNTPPRVTAPVQLPDEEALSAPTSPVEPPAVIASEEPRLLPTTNRKDIPMQHRKKYDALFRKLQNTGRFHVDSNGQAILGDSRAIEGSNYNKLMRSLFVSSAVSDSAVGRQQFLEAVRNVGVRASEVSSQSARLFLLRGGDQGGRGYSTGFVTPPGKRVRILRVY